MAPTSKQMWVGGILLSVCPSLRSSVRSHAFETSHNFGTIYARILKFHKYILVYAL